MSSEPARIDVDGDRVTVTHPSFFGAIDIPSRATTFEGDAEAREVFQRVVLSCELPLAGGVLLHAAGADANGEAVVFCGRSGAGKTTMATLLPLRILSDELIVVRPGFTASSTGLLDDPPSDLLPLRAIYDLGRGPALRSTRLTLREAMHRLLGVAVVPPHPLLWRAALPVLGALVERVPVFELAWTPGPDEAKTLASRLADGGEP